ncbi:heavy metal-associated isoprenylated plant protein 35-like [Zingiber officinale]|uniref:heavy metal-associated isoprenylated plant protein 35-like n=1 Tax=Zingiber officinale TaxID=94328 RepID=UPI001C4C3663|nr:heavy metal-associated isoprenylated plant protein 35-like [Zingiber officinale]
MAAAEQVPEPLNYQTVALKVSIHCEGCKREVKRVLHHIEGVYRVSIDLPQHKVVVTCNVAAETLIKKLNKTGKHAELWPEPTPPEGIAGAGTGGKKKRNKKKKNKNKNISSAAPPANEPPPQKPEGDRTSSDEEENPSEAPGKPEAAAPPALEKQGGAEPAAANGGGGGGRKKKGKKGGHSNGGGGGGNESETAAQVEGGGTVSSPAVNIYTGKLPTYVVSYSSVQPVMGHGRAYIHDPSPVQQGSYVYSTASAGSYYIFSEENANACFVM